jgi:uncharacterized protein (TIGR00369 family)
MTSVPQDSAFLGEALPIPLNDAERQAFLDGFNAAPLMVHMGARIDLSHPAIVSVSVDHIMPHHRGGMGGEAVNGGVLSALLDFTLGTAGVLHLGAGKGEWRAGTIELSIQFLRAFQASRIFVRAAVVKKSRQLAFARSEAIDDRGRVCTTATGIVASAS